MEQVLKLKQEYLQREKELKQIFNRSLSFQDAMFDRWKRAKRLNFGEGASIYNSSLVFGDVQVGKETWVGPYTILDGSGGKLKIGDYCSISSGVQIYTHDSVMWSLSGGKHQANKADVKIASCCYIGSQSIIKAGVKIDEQVVIGANSFVNSDVAPRTIVAGTPAKKIGEVVVTDGNIKLFYK